MDTGALFDNFVAANTFRGIQSSFHQICTALEIDPCDSQNVYKSIRTNLHDWKAEKLWKLLDKRVEQAEYRKQRAADRLATLVIGAGPCGLRSAIECALLGSRVVVIEQRDRFSRNNVLHLWEFVIHDLKALGAKIFYPKFCTGSIEHISIRQLQCILMKVALVFGVQVHEGVSFSELVLPKENPDGTVSGFRASLLPEGHILSDFEFDVLIGADGKRNTVPGFQRDEMRGKLAIAITANFVNNKTSAEERVPEISGVAYIFNQSFFKEMCATTGVDLENIVYYKDETHYFVMCAKKQSLLEMGVILKDNDDVTRLLSADNVDRDALCNYARAAADFATHGKLPALDFAKNHRGQEDIAMFDFTSLYSAKCAVRLIERKNKRLLMGIVGDSLHEPFWPTGSGCARGFLGVFDTAWLIRDYGMNQRGPLEMIADRESIYKLLAQVTKDNMHKAIQKYTIDPKTRYVSPELNLYPEDMAGLLNTDNPRTMTVNEVLPLNNKETVHQFTQQTLSYAIWRFCHHVLAAFKLKMFDLDVCWRDGRALAALLSKFVPEKFDYFTLLAIDDVGTRLQAIFTAVEEELQIPSPCSPADWPRLSKSGKQNYIGRVVGLIRADTDRLMKSLITPKSTMKRRIQPIQMTRRKTQPIEELAQNLLGCSTFQNGGGCPDEIPSKNNKENEAERHAKRLERLVEKEKEKDVNANVSPLIIRYRPPEPEKKEEESKYQRKRPPVERLNPDLVNKVERIVTGDLVKEKERQNYDEKDRAAAKKSQKLDRNGLQAMEQRLMEAGLQKTKMEHMTSQEEKIMKAVANDARREAESGFSRTIETERFKQYDETIKKSGDVLKMKDVAGIDPFHRRRDPLPAKKANILEDQENNVVLRPTVPVQPKRHSIPVMEPSYDTVNARKQTNCQLCNKVVYLAERMQVESIFIHKNCFRCAYCNQPLRLGECGKDKDLEYHCPNKFFCNTHLRVPLKEKIAKIERAARLTRGNSKEKETVVVPPLPATRPPQDDYREKKATLSFFSPEQLRNNTTERMMSSMRTVVSPVTEFVTSREALTPERAEFGVQKTKSTVEDDKKEIVRMPSGSESEEDEEETASGPATPPDGPPRKAEEDDDSLSDGDGLEEDEIAELETTVLQLADEHPCQPITEQQVLSVIDMINRRRASSIVPGMQQTTQMAPSPMFEEYLTPEVTFRTPARPEISRERARTIAAMPTEDEISTEYKTPSLDDIRKQKQEELVRLRNESRARAASKTDAELGLGELASVKRNSLQFHVPSTPVTSRSYTVSPPTDRNKLRSSSLLNDMPSLHRAEIVQKPLEVTVQKEEPPSQGMLAKLFSPDAIRKKATSPSAVQADKVHCESRKETSILGNAFRRLKVKKGETPPKEPVLIKTPEPRVAAVAPSPRVNSDLDSPSTSLQIPITEKSLKLFTKRAEKIIRQRDEALPRTAQEIERSIQQNEIRLDEIRQIGEQHEKKLTIDPTNRWELECWLALVREREALKDAIEASKKRLRKLELQVRYKELNSRHKMNQDEMSDPRLLGEMLAIAEERHRLDREGDVKFKKFFNMDEVLEKKNHDYRNFQPVFSQP